MTMTMEEAEKLLNGGFYTTDEVAKKLGVTTQTVIKWLRSGDYQYVQVSRKIRIPRTTLLQLLNDNLVI